MVLRPTQSSCGVGYCAPCDLLLLPHLQPALHPRLLLLHAMNVQVVVGPQCEAFHPVRDAGVRPLHGFGIHTTTVRGPYRKPIKLTGKQM